MENTKGGSCLSEKLFLGLGAVSVAAGVYGVWATNKNVDDESTKIQAKIDAQNTIFESFKTEFDDHEGKMLEAVDDLNTLVSAIPELDVVSNNVQELLTKLNSFPNLDSVPGEVSSTLAVANTTNGLVTSVKTTVESNASTLSAHTTELTAIKAKCDQLLANFHNGVRALFSASNGINYNSSTGAFTSTFWSGATNNFGTSAKVMVGATGLLADAPLHVYANSSFYSAAAGLRIGETYTETANPVFANMTTVKNAGNGTLYIQTIKDGIGYGDVVFSNLGGRVGFGRDPDPANSYHFGTGMAVFDGAVRSMTNITGETLTARYSDTNLSMLIISMTNLAGDLRGGLAMTSNLAGNDCAFYTYDDSQNATLHWTAQRTGNFVQSSPWIASNKATVSNSFVDPFTISTSAVSGAVDMIFAATTAGVTWRQGYANTATSASAQYRFLCSNHVNPSLVLEATENAVTVQKLYVTGPVGNLINLGGNTNMGRQTAPGTYQFFANVAAGEKFAIGGAVGANAGIVDVYANALHARGDLIVGDSASDWTGGLGAGLTYLSKKNIGSTVKEVRMGDVFGTDRSGMWFKEGVNTAWGFEAGATNNVFNIRSQSLIGITLKENTTNTLVGINATDPQYPLHVRSTAVFDIGSNAYAIGDASAGWQHIIGNPASNQLPTTIRAEGWIAASGIGLESDPRIKTEGRSYDDSYALTQLRQIDPKLYRYIDPLRGPKEFLGVFADNVAQVLPQAVKTSKGFIDDINEVGIVSGKKITLPKEHKLKVGNKVKITTQKQIWVVATVKEVNSPKIFTVESETPIPDGNVKVHGKEVDDFRSVMYDEIFMLGFSATQEIDRKQQLQESKMKEMEKLNSIAYQRIADLENLTNALKAQVEAAVKAMAAMNISVPSVAMPTVTQMPSIASSSEQAAQPQAQGKSTRRQQPQAK